MWKAERFDIKNVIQVGHLLLPIYTQVVLVRAVVDAEESEDGSVYNIMFGHTALGSHAIDIFSTRGFYRLC